MTLKKTIQNLTDQIFTTYFSQTCAILTIFSVFLVFFLTWLGVLEPVENSFLDFRISTRHRLQYSLPRLLTQQKIRDRSDQILIAQITDDCLAEYGKWPWKREVFSRLIEFLSLAQASTIVFDINFFDHDKEDPDSDEKFSQAVQASANVILASELTRQITIAPKGNVLEIPSSNETLGEESIVENRAFESLSKASKSKGFVNIDIRDGVVRKIPLVKRIGFQNYLSLAFAAFESLAPSMINILSPQDILIGNYKIPVWNRFARSNLGENLLTNEIDLPFFEHYAYLNWLGSSSSGAFQSVSISDILAKKVDPRIFQGKIVIVGFNAKSIDKQLTPFGIMPGVEIQATVIQNLMDQSFLKRNSNSVIFLILMISAWICWQINMKRNFRFSVLFHVIFFFFLFFISLILLGKFLWIMDLIPIFLLASTLFVTHHLLLFSRKLARKMYHLEVLNQVSKKLFTILDPEMLSSCVFEILKEFTGAHNAVILTVDPVSEQAEYSNFGKFDDDFMITISKKNFREGVFQFFSKNQAPAFLKDIAPVLGENTPLFNGSAVIFPLWLKEKPYGAMIILKDDFANLFAEKDESFWITLCQIVVAALENARLYRLATVDGLTGLFVRSFFDVQIQKEFLRATRYGGSVGYMMSDIDHFKNFNDSYGHDMGDRVLRIVADEIRKSVRNVDIAARYGGEELCVILPETDKEGSLIIAERVRKNIESLRIPHKGEEIRITCSIGVSSIPENNPIDVKQFLKQADEALYLAKQNGRNQVRFYESRKE